MITHGTQAQHILSSNSNGNGNGNSARWQPVTLHSLTKGPKLRYWIVDTKAEIAADATAGFKLANDALLQTVQDCKKELKEAEAERRWRIEAPGGVNCKSR